MQPNGDQRLCKLLHGHTTPPRSVALQPAEVVRHGKHVVRVEALLERLDAGNGLLVPQRPVLPERTPRLASRNELREPGGWRTSMNGLRSLPIPWWGDTEPPAATTAWAQKQTL